MSAIGTPVEHFEALYASAADPWGYETSAYEQDKVRHTLASLGRERYRRGLEVGCSIGVLAERLAERCDRLTAIDHSPTAVERAASRLAGSGHVETRRGSIPAELPAGPWDLIVCSEVLYYLTEAQLGEAVGRLAGSLAAGGELIAVHWRTPGPERPVSAEAVHAALCAEPRLRVSLSDDTPSYLLTRLDG